MKRRLATAWISICVAIVVCAGCKSLGTVIREAPELEDISPQRKVREADALQNFDEKRNDIQIKAAQGHWQEGDVEACVEAIHDVLSRTPDHVAANRLLEKVAAATRPAEGDTDLASVTEEVDQPRKLAAREPLFPAPALPPELPPIVASSPLPQLSSAQAHPLRQVAHISATLPHMEHMPQHNGSHTPAPSVATLPPATLPPRQASDRSAHDMLREAGRALSRNEVAQARQLLQTVVNSETADKDIAVSAATLPLRYDQPDLSIEVVKLAIPQFADSAALFRVAGTAHYRLGDFQSSQLAFRQALSLDSRQPLTYFLLGLALQKTGDHEAAQWHLRQARHRDVQSITQR